MCPQCRTSPVNNTTLTRQAEPAGGASACQANLSAINQSLQILRGQKTQRMNPTTCRRSAVPAATCCRASYRRPLAAIHWSGQGLPLTERFAPVRHGRHCLHLLPVGRADTHLLPPDSTRNQPPYIRAADFFGFPGFPGKLVVGAADAGWGRLRFALRSPRPPPKFDCCPSQSRPDKGGSRPTLRINSSRVGFFSPNSAL